MSWSPQQDQALLDVQDWLDNSDQQVMRLFGYAGTGKTTLARHFASGVDGQVDFCAFTGKAAHVLRQKGCSDASTIHSLIYHSKDKSRATLKELEAALADRLMELRSAEGPDAPQSFLDSDKLVLEMRRKIKLQRDDLSTPSFTLNRDSEVRKSKLIVVDEASMPDERIGMDLCSFGVKILALGDPAQLPPVSGNGFFTNGHKPDIMLTDIHRQALDNPIIHMATQTRNEEPLPVGNYGESMVVEKIHLPPGAAQEADQLLVGRNKTRHTYNNRMRALHGYESELPEPKDKLVCLRNDHDVGLLNGAIWYTEDSTPGEEGRQYLKIRSEDGNDVLEGVEAHNHYFLGKESELHWTERKDAQEFDYGYALTVHKSQGSQWDNVVVFDESWCFRKDRWKHLYTALTRAAEKVIMVKM